jgi:hypothetical protein
LASEGDRVKAGPESPLGYIQSQKILKMMEKDVEFDAE